MAADLIRFDEFEVDLRGYQLRRSGRTLKLERIPMEVLFLLVERRGQLVTREEIIEKLWGRTSSWIPITQSILRSGKSAKSSKTTPNNRALSRPSRGEVTDS